jgi:flagellar basal-body rod modification protein FlgD
MQAFTEVPTMATSGISSLTGGQSSASSGNAIQQSVAAATGLTSDQFMQLLVAQVQNQDPLDPMTNADFAAQLAQFASLQGINQMNSSFSNLLLVQELTQGANLVGKTVSYQQPGTTTVSQGNVDQVTVQNGQLRLLIGGNAVTLDQVRGIIQTPAANASTPGS